MATSQDNGNRSESSPTMPYYLVGAALGSVGWDKSLLLAKVALHFFGDQKGIKDTEKIVEVSLWMLMLLTFCSILVGSRAAKRGWVSNAQVLGLMIAALITAALSIANETLTNSETVSLFCRTTYFLFWVAWLWLAAPCAAPSLLLKSQLPENRSSMIVDLMAASCFVALICFGIGFFMTIGGEVLPCSFDWVVEPLVLNVICSGLFVVASLPFWWQREQQHPRHARARLHVVYWGAFAVLPVAYGGVYGLAFSDASWWWSFLTYGVFLAVTVVTIVIVFWVSASPGRCRWAVLSLGLAAAFGTVAAFFIPSLAEKCLSLKQYHLLIAAHALDGFLLGTAFSCWEILREMLRGSWERFREWLSARWRMLSRWLWGDDCVRIS